MIGAMSFTYVSPVDGPGGVVTGADAAESVAGDVGPGDATY